MFRMWNDEGDTNIQCDVEVTQEQSVCIYEPFFSNLLNEHQPCILYMGFRTLLLFRHETNAE